MLSADGKFRRSARTVFGGKGKAGGGVSLIDSGDYPERFRGGYYLLAEHWNERGINEVATIILEFMDRPGD